MHWLLDVRPWPRVLLRYPLLILTALLLGAGLSFAYSYAPLHRAKDWQIDYLEKRLQSRNEQVVELEEQLAKANASLEGTPSSEEVQALRTQLDEATRLADSRKQEIDAAARKLKSMTRSRDSWKQRQATTLAELEALSSPTPAPEAVTPSQDLAEEPSGPPADAEPAPASPAPAKPAPTRATQPSPED